MKKNPIRIVITGGGTGGHLSPAIAVIEALREKVPDEELDLLYIGSRTGAEARLIPVMGIPYKAVSAGKIRRYLSLANLADLPKIPAGIVQALFHLLRFRPHAVLATGGYVSVPATVAAGLLRQRVLVHEQTGALGLANRLNARFASLIALSVPGSERHVRGRKWVMTGSPVRGVVLTGDKVTAARRFRFDLELPTVYITGGAQGARAINRVVGESLHSLLTITQVIHSCGDSPGTHEDYAWLAQKVSELPSSLQRRYALMRYIGQEIGEVYALSDLVISRAGAGTVNEIATLGKPALLIPLPSAAGDEQRHNARRLAEIGAAVVIEEAELTPDRLVGEVAGLLSDPERLEAMAGASRADGRGDSAAKLADLLIEMAQRRS